MPEKVTLLELHEACEDEASRERAALSFYREHPDLLRPGFIPGMQRRARIFESAASIFAAMATYEDDSRKFVSSLFDRWKKQ